MLSQPEEVASTPEDEDSDGELLTEDEQKALKRMLKLKERINV